MNRVSNKRLLLVNGLRLTPFKWPSASLVLYVLVQLDGRCFDIAGYTLFHFINAFIEHFIHGCESTT